MSVSLLEVRQLKKSYTAPDGGRRAVAAVLFRPRGQAAGESVPPSVETVNL